MRVRSPALCMLLLVNLASCGSDLQTNEMINGGGSSESDGMWVSAPSLYLRRDYPGIMVGMVRPPRKPRAYAYVFVMKGDEQRRTFAHFEGQSRAAGTTTSDGANAKSNGTLVIGTQKMVFKYEFQIAATAQQEAIEKLVVDGKAYDLRLGRIFLVDLSPQGGKLQQVHADLPVSPPWPANTKQVEFHARELIGIIRHQSDAVRQFLK